MKIKIKSHHRLLVIFLCGVIVSTLIGCFPTEKRQAETESDTAENAEVISNLKMVPETVDYESDTVRINAQVDIADTDSKLDILSAGQKTFSYEEIKRILPEDEAFEQIEVPDEFTKVFLGDAGGMLTFSPGSIYYISGRSSKKSYSLVLESGLPLDDRYINNGVFPDEDIEGLDRNEAIEQARQCLREIGIENAIECGAVALDFATLSEEYEKLAGKFPKETREFEKDDEGYYLVFRCGYKNIPLLAQDYYLRSKAMCFGSVIKMIITRNGLQQLSAQGIYDISETGESADSIYDFNKIIDAIKVRYQDLMLALPVTVSRIELIYAPDILSVDPVRYELSPCWAVYASTSGEKERTNIFIYYSAMTGKELEVDRDQ